MENARSRAAKRCERSGWSYRNAAVPRALRRDGFVAELMSIISDYGQQAIVILAVVLAVCTRAGAVGEYGEDYWIQLPGENQPVPVVKMSQDGVIEEAGGTVGSDGTAVGIPKGTTEENATPTAEACEVKISGPLNVNVNKMFGHENERSETHSTVAFMQAEWAGLFNQAAGGEGTWADLMNAIKAQSDAQGNENPGKTAVQDAKDGWTDGAGAFKGGVGAADLSAVHNPEDWRIYVGSDLWGSADPAENPQVASGLNFIKALLSWLMVLGLAFACWHEADKHTIASILTPQATSSGQAIFGWNINLAAAQTMGVLITTALAVLPAFAYVVVHQHLDTATVTPMAQAVAGNFGHTVQMAMHLVGLVIDMSVLLVCLADYVTFRFAVGVLYQGVTAAVRQLTG